MCPWPREGRQVTAPVLFVRDWQSKMRFAHLGPPKGVTHPRGARCVLKGAAFLSTSDPEPLLKAVIRSVRRRTDKFRSHGREFSHTRKTKSNDESRTHSSWTRQEIQRGLRVRMRERSRLRRPDSCGASNAQMHSCHCSTKVMMSSHHSIESVTECGEYPSICEQSVEEQFSVTVGCMLDSECSLE